MDATGSAKADSRVDSLAKTTGSTVQRILIDSIGLKVGEDAWRLAGPATLTLDSVGSRIDSLVLRNKDVAVMALSGNIPNVGAAAVRMDASGIPLRDFGILAQLSDTLSGTGELTSAVNGTRDKPQVAARATLTSVKWQGVEMDRIVANAEYDAARLNADLDVVRSGQHAVTGRVSLPLELTLPLATRWRRTDTISGLIKADSTDLSLLQTVLGTSTVRTVSGRLVADVGISGTASAPVLSGTASVYNGSAFVVPAGVTFHDISAHLVGGRDALGHDSITIDSITARTGGTKDDPIVGRASITGTLKAIMESNGEPSFALALGLDKFHAYNKRSNAEVWLSTEGDSVRLRGSIAASNLTGALRVDHGSIFLADPEIARKQAVQFGLAGDSIGVAAHTVSATMQRFLTNLQIQPPVPVTLGNDVRLRSKDANVKLVGELQIEKSTQRTARTIAASGELVPGLDLLGALRTESGTYNLNLGVVQREFQVRPGGTVTFDGPPQDPTLNIDAVYDVRQVRDFQVIVNMNGRLLPYPVIDFKSNQSYSISTSDLLSYLLTGAPGFDFGANAGTQQILSSVLAPTVSAVAAAGLRTALGGWVDAFQLQLGSSGTATGQDALRNSLQGSTIGAEKQFGSNVYLNVNTGFCQFAQQSGQPINPLAGVGAQAEYRFNPKLSLKLAYDPPTANRNCSQAALIGLAPTPSNFSFSLTHAWRF